MIKVVRTVSLIAATIFSVSALLGLTDKPVILTVRGHVLEVHPLPHYPDEARKDHLVGKSVLSLHVRTDGVVDAAKIIKSTGYKILDDEAIRTMRTWRFRPENRDFTVKVPCDFELGKNDL